MGRICIGQYNIQLWRKPKSITHSGREVSIEIRGGTYSLDRTIEISSTNYSLRSLTIKPYSTEKVIITGSKKLNLQWKPYKDGIVKASLDMEGLPDRLYINGAVLHMARYPNYDATARVFNGTAADAISDERLAGWKNPAGGFIHTLHQGEGGHFITASPERMKMESLLMKEDGKTTVPRRCINNTGLLKIFLKS